MDNLFETLKSSAMEERISRSFSCFINEPLIVERMAVSYFGRIPISE